MPHFSAAVILQIIVVLNYERWSVQGGWRPLGVLTLALVLESFVQPYIVVLFGPLLVLMTAYRVFVNHKLALKRALWLILPLGLHALLVVYQLVAVNGDPVWTSFSAQNITLSPPVFFYLLGYLPFLLPIAFGLLKLRQRDECWWVLVVWVLLVVLLVYVPLPTQRRYLLGVQTPLAVLAAFGWTHGILPRIRRGYRPLATGVYVLLAALGMVALLFADLAASLRTKDTAYYSPEAWGAVEWLRENADNPHDLVLTTFNRAGQGSGGRVVAATGMRVFAGHWIETAFLDDKVEQLRRFYDPTTADDWRQEFLNAIGATYVWYDENSSAFGAWNPGSADTLAPVYKSDSVSLYRVMR
jgi:hypothetical protein